jgi:hypothetical protein
MTMPVFKDTAGREWQVRFDGLLLLDLRQAESIDLADVSGQTYARLERDPALLTAALCVLVRDQLAELKLTRQQFAQVLAGEAFEQAFAALWEAAQNFFPPKLRSALASNLAQHREALDQWEQLRPMMAMLDQPDMPAAMKSAVMEAIASQIKGMTAGDLQSLRSQFAASGPAAIPPCAASSSPEPVASAPAA